MSAASCEPLEGLPPAHRAHTGALLAHGWEHVDAEEVNANFASELADQVREARDVIAAAGLVDPYDGETWPHPDDKRRT